MRWWSYVTQVSGGNQTEIAYKVGVSVPSVSRWRTSAPKPQNVVAFARAYDRPVIEAFIAAGYLTEADVQEKLVVDRPISELSNAELLAEVERRIEHSAVPDTPASIPLRDQAAAVKDVTRAGAEAELARRKRASKRDE